MTVPAEGRQVSLEMSVGEATEVAGGCGRKFEADDGTKSLNWFEECFR